MDPETGKGERVSGRRRNFAAYADGLTYERLQEIWSRRSNDQAIGFVLGVITACAMIGLLGWLLGG